MHETISQLTRNRWRGIGVQNIAAGSKESFREARCKLPFVSNKLRHLPRLLLVSVSNNGVLTSRRLKFLIYHSACQRCLRNGVCYRRVSASRQFSSTMFLVDLHSCFFFLLAWQLIVVSLSCLRPNTQHSCISCFIWYTSKWLRQSRPLWVLRTHVLCCVLCWLRVYSDSTHQRNAVICFNWPNPITSHNSPASLMSLNLSTSVAMSQNPPNFAQLLKLWT